MSNTEVAIALLKQLEKTEEQRNELLKALESLIFDVPTDTVRCRGDKCRKLYCESCNGEEDAEIAIQEIMFKVDKAKQVITKAKVE